jgi:hypothetical protein
MTEETPTPSIDHPNSPSAAVQPPSRRDPFPLLYGVGFLILAAAIFYVWKNPNPPVETAAEAAAKRATEQRITEIDTRLAKLEQRPEPDFGRIVKRMDALDGRIADQTQVGTRLDTLSGRIEALAGRDQAAQDAVKQQTEGLGKRIASMETKVGGLDVVSKRLNRIARLQEAAFALAAGHPVGDLPDAPEALSRFAHAAPPTESQIRLRFPIAERAALAAKQPDTEDGPFAGRVWERAQGLLTIRRGDDVVIGQQASIVLGQARTALDAGDLAGAVSAVSELKGPPSQAMADWLADARALLGARSALASMADQA